MNKEEKDLIQCDLVLTYIKNKDYSTYYRRKVDGMAIDNDILKNEDNLYITTSKKYNSLQQENKQLKELISTILNWNIFNGECPMNFAYDKNTIEDKAQEVFFQDDNYCENNCDEDCKKCWLKYFNKMQELESGDNNGI